MKPKVLVVDDEPGIRFAVRLLLEDDGFEVLDAPSAEDALDSIDAHPDLGLVISDLRMPGMGGMGLLATLASRPGAPSVVVVTAHGNERVAVDAIKAGAVDYFAKPFNETELLAVVHRSMRTAALSRRVQSLEAARSLRRTMVFASEAMHRVAELVHRIAPRDVSVLITGESGTGKELVARALVGASPRAAKPWVPFNCAALSKDLAEAELFGHAKGAFTGASSARPGFFREAHGGTLFLDEVGELDPGVQASLLRVLQERRVRPVGTSRAMDIDVRILAATNRDLAGDPGFRDDLYYRLNVVEIRLPPLRQRREDIIPLARAFAASAADHFGLGVVQLSPALERRLQQDNWPGNVRQLKHHMQRLVALAHGDVIGLEDDRLARGGQPDTSVQPGTGLKAQVASFEAKLLTEMLRDTGGNRSEAARKLQVSRMTLVTKLKKYGIS